MPDFSHILTVLGTWVVAHVSAPTVQVTVDKVFGRTNGSRKISSLTLLEFKETLNDAFAKASATQLESLKSIAESNQKISTNMAILVDRSR